jgi:hypothetical protein
MIEELYFNPDEQIRISAASVGISKRRWACATTAEANINSIKEKMSKGRYDVLPILEDNGSVRDFYITNSPDDFSEIKKETIAYKDTMPLDTDISVVISKFNNEKRRYFFLTRNKEVVGLITLGNLNCKQVQIYIYNVICELETLLGDFVNHHLSKEQVMAWLQKKSSYTEILKQYNKLVEVDLENSITEHFYFKDLFEIIKSYGLAKELGFTNTQWTNFNSINEIRKKIAHPTRSLLDSENNIEKLNSRLNNINELIFCLRNLEYL